MWVGLTQGNPTKLLIVLGFAVAQPNLQDFRTGLINNFPVDSRKNPDQFVLCESDILIALIL